MASAGFDVFGRRYIASIPIRFIRLRTCKRPTCILRQAAILIAFGCRRKGNTAVTLQSGASVQDRCRIQVVVYNRHCIGYNLRVDLISALKKAKQQDFSCYTWALISFALATKVTFTNFDLSAENRVSLLLKMICVIYENNKSLYLDSH